MTEHSERPSTFWTRCAGVVPRDRRNLRLMARVYVLWAVAYLGSSQLIKREIVPDGPAAWALVVVTIGLGVLVPVTYGRFLREADELLRTIHLYALALGFGGTWIAVASYGLLMRVGAPPADIADATLALAAFYGIGMVRGTLRYR